MKAIRAIKPSSKLFVLDGKSAKFFSAKKCGGGGSNPILRNRHNFVTGGTNVCDPIFFANLF